MAKSKQNGEGGETEKGDKIEKNGARAADREEVNALIRKATGLHLIHASDQKARRTDVLKASLQVYIKELSGK